MKFIYLFGGPIDVHRSSLFGIVVIAMGLVGCKSEPNESSKPSAVKTPAGSVSPTALASPTANSVAQGADKSTGSLSVAVATTTSSAAATTDSAAADSSTASVNALPTPTPTPVVVYDPSLPSEIGTVDYKGSFVGVGGISRKGDDVYVRYLDDIHNVLPAGDNNIITGGSMVVETSTGRVTVPLKPDNKLEVLVGKLPENTLPLTPADVSLVIRGGTETLTIKVPAR